MSQTETKERTLETVSNEYAQACAQLGDRFVKIQMLNADIRKIEESIAKLNSEAAALNAAKVAEIKPATEAQA